MQESMTFEKFKAIMDTIIAFNEKRDKFSRFIEEEISTSTFCVVDFGCEVENALINLLADEFKCWYKFQDRDYDWWNDTSGLENDIEAWLYDISDEPKVITMNDIEYNIDSLESFYEFLVKQYNENLTQS